MRLTRRGVLAGAGCCAATNLAILQSAESTPASGIETFRTPHKYGRLVLGPSRIAGSFDERSVDCPFVFSVGSRFYMTYVGFDGTGYQTGLAESGDLVRWQRAGLIFPRDPSSPVTRFNAALMCILRDDALHSSAPLKKVNGRYLGAWHAYPNPGYEVGPAVIGLAWSDDLHHWERTAPVLEPDPNAAWEAGGLYKPYLVKDGDTYYLFYNAKNTEKRWQEQTGLATSKDLKTCVRHPGNPIIPNGPESAWDARFASDPAVLRVGRQWVLYYFGLASDGKARDLLALGADPYHFAKVPEIMVDVGPPGSVDETYAHKPALITWHRDLYHFYCAVSGRWPNELRGISVARSRPWSS
jgi:predicted GH43/DUF377 family glycosyl hydrolase